MPAVSHLSRPPFFSRRPARYLRPAPKPRGPPPALTGPATSLLLRVQTPPPVCLTTSPFRPDHSGRTRHSPQLRACRA
ncbi:hypothetical protein NDU88_000569 [Pleurodeles waltl]|uniref:Uncharacterized protein n=1 Tax=Pleurodeles waltl TaxID=8319 RepID=A0AAV7TG66_PLEWA|nr:hypothetical protein NDU88_000569 [Pleurodeles waltl]